MIRKKNPKKPTQILKNLRLKFFFIIMAIITIVFGSIFSFASISVKILNEENYDAFSDFLIDHDGLQIADKTKEYHRYIDSRFSLFGGQPPIFAKDVPFDESKLRNFFSVKLTHSGKIIDIVSLHPINYSQDEIADLTDKILEIKQLSGNIEGLRYKVGEKHYGYITVFTDRKGDDNFYYILDKVFLLVYLFSMLLALILALILSKWALQPIKKAFIKQKQFVADASHELKTPLSVIGTNLDVLIDEVGNNKWFGYIDGEVKRMNVLVKDLLYLAKYDSSEMSYDFSSFNLSQAITAATLPFESIAFEQGLTFDVDIESNITYYGDVNRIKQLAVILIDNAIKNCTDNGMVRVNLKITGNKKIFSVYNTGEGLDTVQKKKIFERFYRTDSSRTRDTGGSGLGLSIATTIVQMHRAKINVQDKKGEWIEFSVSF